MRLKSLPPPMQLHASVAPAATAPLPSFPDPETVDPEASISLHDGDFEEIAGALRRPAHVDSSLMLYAVYEGARPGELVLSPVAPDESPPVGVTVVRIKRVNVAPISRMRPIARRR